MARNLRSTERNPDSAQRGERTLSFNPLEPVPQLQILIVLAILVGGGGSLYGLANLAIQLAALLVLGWQSAQVLQFVRHGPRWLVLLVLASIALPLLQLVPLPPQLWQAMPGREPVMESMALIGADGGRWFPLSVNPMRTLVALCATFVPATIIILGAQLPAEDKSLLVRTAIAAGLLAMLIGAVQLSTANTFGIFYPERIEPDVLYGTFANRNSAALCFVLLLTMVASLPFPRHRLWAIGTVVAAALLLLGTILTQSRSGITLLLLPSGLLVLRFLGNLRRSRGGTTKAIGPLVWIAVGGGLLMALALAASVTTGGRAATALERFSDSQTDRPEMWDDALFTAGEYWPAGAGTGAFDDVFQMHESLEYVSPRKAGRAHNDYLELAIEGGIASALIAAGWLLWCGVSSLRPGVPEEWWGRLGAGTGIVAIAAQSTLDYPLRNLALLSLAALLVIMLVRPKVPEQ